MLTRYFIARGGYHRGWNSAALSGVLEAMPEPEPKPRARPAAKPAAPQSAARRAWTTLLTPYDPLTGVVLTIPIFLVYHLGILFVDLRNGADLVTATMLRVLDRSILGYVAITVAVAVGLFVAGRFLRKGHHEIDRHALVRVVSESAIWAALMLLVVGGIVARIFHGAVVSGAIPGTPLQIGGMTLGPLERVVMAAGAGFHEELLFRVILFGGGGWLIAQATKDRTRAEWIAAPIAAVVFSAAHYVGALGDDFELASFTFRALAGLWFTLVYRFRGFAVAVYTHTLYDLFVFFAG
jgi:hypothetical protein